MIPCTLVCGSKNELLDLLNAVKSASEKRGLLLKTKKTKDHGHR